jgi:hypothetical protein
MSRRSINKGASVRVSLLDGRDAKIQWNRDRRRQSMRRCLLQLRSSPAIRAIGGAMGLGTIGEAPRLTLQPISLLTIRKHTLTVSNGLRTSFRCFG